VSKKIEFTDDFSSGFNTQTREIVGEEAENKVTQKAPSIDSSKTSISKKSVKKKSEELKAIRVYLPASLHKKLIKKAADKSVKTSSYCSMSALVRDMVEKGVLS